MITIRSLTNAVEVEDPSQPVVNRLLSRLKISYDGEFENDYDWSILAVNVPLTFCNAGASTINLSLSTTLPLMVNTLLSLEQE